MVKVYTILVLICSLFFVVQAVATDSYSVNGVINSVDINAKSVSIHHEAIPAMGMSAMTMDFLVKDTAVLPQLKSGQKVKFQLVVDEFGRLIIDMLSKVE